MFRNFPLVKISIIYIILICVFVPQVSFAVDIIVNQNVSISARVNPINPPSGGGGGGGSISLPTTINFSGMAYPLSRVYVARDDRVVASTISDQAANFYVSLKGTPPDTYTFSVYVEDSKGRKSSYFSFPIFITEGVTINIGNIFLSPTIDIDKTEVKKGDNLIIFGQSTPNSEVTISVHSEIEHFFKVSSNSIGAYLYNLDTSILEMGRHETKSKTILGNQTSSYTNPVSFSVGNENKIKDKNNCFIFRSDLNCDIRVNLIDFSIMAYWYKKQNPPIYVDLNNDKKITLIDFSILAYHWTG